MSAAPPRPGLAELFTPLPLPRWRAVFSVCCAGAALLAGGGLLEYGFGSPATAGTAAASYWAAFFGLNSLVFTGAGLLAAFPRLARRPLKLAWLAATLALYGATFALWYSRQDEAGALVAWLRHSPAYIPAALTLLIGLALGPEGGLEDPQT